MLQEKSCPIIERGAAGACRIAGGGSGRPWEAAGEWCPTTVSPEGGVGAENAAFSTV
jgi:hypothetical protein